MHINKYFALFFALILIGNAFASPLSPSLQGKENGDFIDRSSLAGENALDSATIGNSEFKLLTNTSQCLIDCEAWVEWDLTNETENKTVSNQKDSQYGFRTIKTKKSKELKDFQITVFELGLKEVTDYCYVEEPFIVKLEESKANTCQQMSCKIGKTEGNCDCVNLIEQECGSHYEDVLINKGSFYGFNAKKGHKYLLQINGTKEAKLGENNVDWIPTFLGQEISKWAWWNANWNYKIPVTIKSSGVLASNTTNDLILTLDINSEQSDFWANVNSDGSDIRFANGAESAELDFNMVYFNYIGERLIVDVEVTDTFQSATDSNVYLYFANAGASDGQDPVNTYNTATAIYHFEESAGTNAPDAKGDFDATVSNASIWTTDGMIRSGTYPNQTYTATQATLLDTMPSAVSFSYWVKLDLTFNSAETVYQGVFTKTNIGGASDYLDSYFNPNNGTLGFDIYKGGIGNKRVATTTTTWNAGQWYHIVQQVSATESRVYVNGVFEATNTDSVIPSNGDAGDFGFFEDSVNREVNGKIDEFKIYNSYLSANDIKILYANEAGHLIQYGLTSEFDANRITADFSYTQTQKTVSGKTVTQIDANNTSEFKNVKNKTYEWYLNDLLISTDENTSFDLNYQGTWDLNYVVRGDNLFNAETYDSDSNQSISLSGYFQIHFTDENSFETLNPTVTVNGVSTATASGLITIDTNNSTTKDYTIVAGIDGTYPTRTWKFGDLNQFATNDINAVLLKTGSGRNIDFQFWNDAGTSTIPNYYLEIWKGGSTESTDLNYAGRVQLNDTGRTTLFLDNNTFDANYLFVPISSTGTKSYYHTVDSYILKPKNETTLAEISPFDARTSNITSFQWLSITAPVSYRAFPNTEDYYVLDVNASGYYPRTYYHRILGGTTDYNTQPYLASIAEGAFQSVIFTRTSSNFAVPNYQIVVKKDISGIGLTTVETKVTDVAGSATFSFISGDTYFLTFIFDGSEIWTNAELRPVFTQYQFYPASGGVSVSDVEATVFKVDFYPSQSWIDTNTLADVNLYIHDVNGAGVKNINILAYFDNNTLIDINTTTLGFWDLNIGVVDANITQPLVIEVILETDRGEIIVRKMSYTINLSNIQSAVLEMIATGIPDALNLNRNSHHKEGATMLSVLLVLLIVGAISRSGRVDFTGSAVLSMILLGFFMVIGWVVFELYVAALIVTTALVLLSRGVF